MKVSFYPLNTIQTQMKPYCQTNLSVISTRYAIKPDIKLKDDTLSITPDTHFEAIKRLKSHQSLEANLGMEALNCLVLGHLVNDVRTYYITAENKERERIKALIYQELPLLEQMPIVQNNF